jgi:hypothetical protein
VGKKRSRASRTLRPGQGALVRRTDKLGRVYYADRRTGKRAKAVAWVAEREAVAFERARGRADAEERAELGLPSEVRGAFPPGVTETGVPRRGVWVDEDGVAWDLESVEGEDETG